jgi:hypothetical protein
MLEVRPLVVADGVVIGGNMRLLAMKDLGFREVSVIDVTEWTQAKRDEFMIKDNTHFGSWDYDALANEWDNLPLNEWGMAVWEQEEEPVVIEQKEFPLENEVWFLNIEFKNESEVQKWYEKLSKENLNIKIVQ